MYDFVTNMLSLQPIFPNLDNTSRVSMYGMYKHVHNACIYVTILHWWFKSNIFIESSDKNYKVFFFLENSVLNLDINIMLCACSLGQIVM